MSVQNLVKGISKPKTTTAPAQTEPKEEVRVVTEEAEEARRRQRRGLSKGSRAQNLVAGIRLALQRRLGRSGFTGADKTTTGE